MKVEQVIVGHETLYRWTIGSSVFIACPQQGGRLLNWHLQMPDGSVRDIVHWPSNTYDDEGGNRLGFPVLGSLSHNGVECQWEAPDGRILPMPKDGFAHNSSFEVTTCNEQSLLLRLTPTESMQAAYPFRCACTLSYRFRELSFCLNMQLENFEAFPIPWGGGQQWFLHIPWHSELTLKDYQTDISARKVYRLTGNGAWIPFDKTSKGPTTLDTFELYHLVYSKIKNPSISLGPKSGEENMHFICHASPTADTQVGLWSRSKGCCCLTARVGSVEEPLVWVPARRTATLSCEISLL